MESEFIPKATGRDTSGRSTFVVLDMDDYSIPDNLPPHLIVKKIKAALFEAGYRRSTPTFRLWVAENQLSEHMLSEFRNSGVFVHTKYQGSRNLKHQKIMVSALYSVWQGMSNVLILSKHHESMEQDRDFSHFRETLEKRGGFLVLAKPEKLINDSINDRMIEYGRSAKLSVNLDR